MPLDALDQRLPYHINSAGGDHTGQCGCPTAARDVILALKECCMTLVELCISGALDAFGHRLRNWRANEKPKFATQPQAIEQMAFSHDHPTLHLSP
jgi:hypothetical protein